MKEIKMTIPQFLAYERGEKSLKDIELENGMESIARKIINNDRLRKITVFTIASLNYNEYSLCRCYRSSSKNR